MLRVENCGVQAVSTREWNSGAAGGSDFNNYWELWSRIIDSAGGSRIPHLEPIAGLHLRGLHAGRREEEM